MRIGGLQRLTLIDYPGKVAATVFTQGCNLRCGYCHNPELVLPERRGPSISQDRVLDFLEERRSQLQGVVVTGGEPTIQHDLDDFLRKLKQLGFAVKLDTNGIFPGALENIIREGLVDYIAMDIKTSLKKYHLITGVACSVENIKRSIQLIRNSGAEFEFRTTVVKPYCTEDDIREIKTLIGSSDKYTIQRFQASEKIIDPALLNADCYSDKEMECLGRIFAAAA